MNNPLFVIALILIALCNICIVLLYFKIARYMQTPHDIYGNQMVILDWLSEVVKRQRGIKQALLDDGRLTRKDIQEVKTALRDDEKDDQREKARVRYHKRHR